ncbi:MAG: tetratricopeptide repeat protein [Candidatus Obscuribacterales bacterium]|nr:tetratricopeptide repeat protein [Candidatus Obscuribacterales bacterium]
MFFSSDADSKISEQVVRTTLLRAKSAGINMSAQDAEMLSQQADDIYDEGKMQAARQIMSIVCASKSVNCKYLCQLADYCTDVLGEIDEQQSAHKYLNQAIKLDPNCSRAWDALAKLSLKEGDVANALRYSNRAIAMPQGREIYPNAFATRATILAQMKRYEAALVDINRAKKAMPDVAEFWRIDASILENLKRYPQAVQSYRTSLKFKKVDWAQYRLISCLERQKKYKEAIIELDAITKSNPSDAEAYRARSEIREKINDLSGAVADLSRALELEPTTKYYLERAKLYRRMGKTDLAKKDEQAAEKMKASPF